MPIIALTEWPTKTTGPRADLVDDLDQVVGVALQACRTWRGRRRSRSDWPLPTRSNSTVVKRSANAGASRRHMFWSQPKPCANRSVASPEPETWTLLRERTSMDGERLARGSGFHSSTGVDGPATQATDGNRRGELSIMGDPSQEPDAMTPRFHRRSVLALAAAAVAPAAWSQAAGQHPRGDQEARHACASASRRRRRGSRRTRRSGDWASRRRRLDGQGDGRRRSASSSRRSR